MNALGAHFQPRHVNQNLASGRRPGKNQEIEMINGIHPGMSIDLAKLAGHEQAIRLNRARLIAEANRGAEHRFGIVRSIRANVGGAIVSIGQRVRGERSDAVEATPSAATLRMAR